jgi:hypothetical protein
MEPASPTIREIAQREGIKITRRVDKRVEAIEMIRTKRDSGQQDLAYSARPFVLCGLPVRRPPADQLKHVRRNGKFVLEVTAHPDCGLPYGQDRLIPMFLSTLAVRTKSPEIRFSSAAELLDMFGREKGGAQYKRLIDGFTRIFGATVFFRTDTQAERAVLIHHHRFNFLKEAQLWFSRDPDQRRLPGDLENVVVLSDEFFKEIINSQIPADLEVVRALAHAPAVLDLCVWLMWRCYTARGETRIPLFGDVGLAAQLGSVEYSRERRFRQKLEQWLLSIRAVWPECPAYIAENGHELVLGYRQAIASRT